MKIKRYWPLFLTILILQILAFMTSYFVTEGAVGSWYQGIHKAPLSPPDWVFAPVWTVLYTLLAIALWKLWPLRNLPAARMALALFLIQLVLNYSWSFVFFGMQAFAAAFWLLLAIVTLTIATMALAAKINKSIVWLLAPYLAWTGFASYLSFYVMRLN